MVIQVPREVIEQRYQEIMKLWQKYIDLFDQATATEEYTHEQQDEFLNLILDITRRAQYLTLVVPEGQFDAWKDMRILLVQTPTIDVLRKEPPIRIANYRSMWHDVSIALNQKQGHLKTLFREEDEQKSKGFFSKK